jgi:hypothetical protein
MLATIPMLWVLAAAPSQPAVFDPARRRLRGNQVALDVEGGSITGRAIGQSFIVASQVTYYPLARLGIGAAYGFSRGIGGLDTVRGRFVHLVHGRFELPMVAGLRMGKGDALEMDLFGELGAGAIHIAGDWRVLGVIGGGVRIYPRIPWLSIRVDALTYLHNTARRDAAAAFDTDIAFTVGVAFLLPQRRAAPRPSTATRSPRTAPGVVDPR